MFDVFLTAVLLQQKNLKKLRQQNVLCWDCQKLLFEKTEIKGRELGIILGQDCRHS